MSGIHCQELGIWQYVQGNPQARAGTAVRGEVSLAPTLIPERTEDEGAAKQDHTVSQSGHRDEIPPYLPVVRFVGKLFAAPSGWVGGNTSKTLKLGR